MYPDTAHFDLLEKASDTERDRFFSVWQEKGCELALSLHHLQELGQLSDDASVARRLDVLACFPIIRCKPASETLRLAFDIHLQLYTLIGAIPDVRASALATLFPLADIKQVRDTTLAIKPLVRLMRHACQLGADASNTAKSARHSEPTLNWRKRFTEAQLRSSDLLLDLLPDEPPELRDAMRILFGSVHAEIVTHRSVRGALESIGGVSDVLAVNRILDSDLSLSSAYFSLARSEVPHFARMTNLTMDEGEHLVRCLDPYAAPGFSIYLAVRRARQRHPKPDVAGDEVDLAHVGFAPYVDLLLVDKRTLGFLSQEVRDNPARIADGADRTIARAGSLKLLVEMIASHPALA